MCGIIGLVSEKEVSSTLLEGLKRLEYRGYDSSGIATISDEKIERVRSKGNLSFLEENRRDIYYLHIYLQLLQQLRRQYLVYSDIEIHQLL